MKLVNLPIVDGMCDVPDECLVLGIRKVEEMVNGVLTKVDVITILLVNEE